MKRQPISAFVIARNEEQNIAPCLESVAFCDERLVVLEPRTTDRTEEIAIAHGARVVRHAWTGYRDQKAFALRQLQHDWVLNIDADERISPELQENIERVLNGADPTGQAVQGYYINRLVYFLGRWWRRGGWYPEYRLRFFQRSAVTWGGVEPHERAMCSGKTARLVGDIQHFTYENIEAQLRQLNRFSSIAAQQEFEQGRRFSFVSLVFNPALRMLKFFIIKRGYREGVAGFVVAVNEGMYTFMKYAKLWEFQNFRKRDSASEALRAAVPSERQDSGGAGANGGG